jgi:DNA topoisomerase-1
MCLAPDCITKKGPEIEVGRCAQCGGALKVKYSQVGSRYVRCENYDAAEHPVSYPLPQTGELEPTGETCEPCGAPKVIVHTKKGPWRICIDPDCPARADSKKKAPARKGAKSGAKSAAKAPTKKPAKKPAKAPAKKPPSATKATPRKKSS